ncbi:MAG: transcriptional regulator [Candidatus Pelagibacter sp. TMED64]|nr:transcriptional regulator [Candidatus Pelagibacter sp.]OUU64888.1 MAG: transcriptional regulator [Candidatus Pelagibacter sp. TMED64]|tara:strand:- start:6035 stop:6445 length:411 start_codon:yes stop_codon:yes gene_type:complete
MTETKDSKYLTIGEVAKKLGLVNLQSGKLQTHTIRFWEKQFKQVKPSIRAGNRRYYSKKDFDIIKLIQHLLKDQGMTIKGAKIILKKKLENKLDDNIKFSVDNPLKNNLIIKKKILNIKKLINEINKYKNGKKNIN